MLPCRGRIFQAWSAQEGLAGAAPRILFRPDEQSKPLRWDCYEEQVKTHVKAQCLAQSRCSINSCSFWCILRILEFYTFGLTGLWLQFIFWVSFRSHRGSPWIYTKQTQSHLTSRQRLSTARQTHVLGDFTDATPVLPQSSDVLRSVCPLRPKYATRVPPHITLEAQSQSFWEETPILVVFFLVHFCYIMDATSFPSFPKEHDIGCCAPKTNSAASLENCLCIKVFTLNSKTVFPSLILPLISDPKEITLTNWREPCSDQPPYYWLYLDSECWIHRFIPMPINA